MENALAENRDDRHASSEEEDDLLGRRMKRVRSGVLEENPPPTEVEMNVVNQRPLSFRDKLLNRKETIQGDTCDDWVYEEDEEETDADCRGGSLLSPDNDFKG